jgi:sulfur-oxidizing protein SoxY
MASTQSRPTRRQALATISFAGIAAILQPRLLFADKAAVAEQIRKLYGDKSFSDGKITIDAPQIAENGLLVPVGIEIDSPMTDADHVKAVHVFADGNPLPGVVTFRFTPASGKASAAFRMRLAQTQNIVCIAEMSNGALHMAKTEVKVTIGGCGG